jgi:hypothetical protein
LTLESKRIDVYPKKKKHSNSNNKNNNDDGCRSLAAYYINEL